MRSSKEPRPLSANEDEMTEQQSYELVRKLLLSGEDAEPGNKKRQMLCISNIDPALVDILKARADERGIPLYEYCTDLLRLAMEFEDAWTQPARKSRKTRPNFRRNLFR